MVSLAETKKKVGRQVQRLSHLKKAFLASGFVGACLFMAPQAGAAEESEEKAIAVHHVDAQQVVSDVQSGLKAWGISAPKVDPKMVDAAESTINSALDDAADSANKALRDAGANDIQVHTYSKNQPAPAAPVGEQVAEDVWHPDHVRPEPLTNPNPLGLVEPENPDSPENFTPQTASQDPNYRWKNDPVSRVMAGKPQADYVLHRVPGVWFDAPRIPEKSNKAMSQGKSLYGPGTPIYVGDDTMCTMAVTGYDSAGRKVGITAAHCGNEGDKVASADSWQVGPTGTIVSRDEYLDYAVVELGSNTEVTRSYNGVKVNQLSKRGLRPGQIACKQGVATGKTCGMGLARGKDIQINHVCATVGDSGAPVTSRGRMVGFISHGLFPQQYNPSCKTPLQGALHSPTVVSNTSAVVADMNRKGGTGAGFRLPRK